MTMRSNPKIFERTQRLTFASPGLVILSALLIGGAAVVLVSWGLSYWQHVIGTVVAAALLLVLAAWSNHLYEHSLLGTFLRRYQFEFAARGRPEVGFRLSLYVTVFLILLAAELISLVPLAVHPSPWSWLLAAQAARQLPSVLDNYLLFCLNLLGGAAIILAASIYERAFMNYREGRARAAIPAPTTARYNNAELDRSLNRFHVVHLTDLHCTYGDRVAVELFRGSNDNLSSILAKVAGDLGGNSSAEKMPMIVTGDITDTGHPDEWQEFAKRAEVVEGVCRIFLVPGNHDLNIQQFPLGPKTTHRWAKYYSLVYSGSLDRAGYAYRALLFMHALCRYSPEAQVWQDNEWVSLTQYYCERLPDIDRTAAVLTGIVCKCFRRVRQSGPHARCLRTANVGGENGCAYRSRAAIVHQILSLWRGLYPMKLYACESHVAIALNSVAPASGWVNAFGHIDSSQLDRLAESAVALTREAGTRRILFAVHHHLARPPIEEIDGKIDVYGPGLVISNASELITLLRRHYPDALVIHGHRHIGWSHRWPGSGKTTGLVSLGAPSTTAGDEGESSLSSEPHGLRKPTLTAVDVVTRTSAVFGLQPSRSAPPGEIRPGLQRTIPPASAAQ